MDQKQQLPAAIIIAGLIIGGAILLKGGGSQDGTPSGAAMGAEVTAELSKIRPITKEEHLLGNADADVIIVEYSDTECPFCKRFHATLHAIVEENKGKVAWAYRHYPIPQLHAKAFKEAEATECAWEQGGNDAFWKYTDEIYVRTNSNDSLDVAELPKIASSIGLNVQTFNDCLLSEKYKAKVQADIDNGNVIGVRGTPFSVILKDGKAVDTIGGAQPLETVREKIKAALK